MVRKTVIRCHSEGIGITFSGVSSQTFFFCQCVLISSSSTNFKIMEKVKKENKIKHILV